MSIRARRIHTTTTIIITMITTITILLPERSLTLHLRSSSCQKRSQGHSCTAFWQTKTRDELPTSQRKSQMFAAALRGD